DLAKIQIAPDWITAPEPLATGAGLHRFVWNLQYTPPPELASDDPTDEENGVWAPPGEDWAELNPSRKIYRHRPTIAPDPRLTLPSSAYARHFALARDIERARVQIAVALVEAGKIHSAIGERSNGASSTAAAALSATDRQLLAISDLQPPKGSPDSSGLP